MKNNTHINISTKTRISVINEMFGINLDANISRKEVKDYVSKNIYGTKLWDKYLSLCLSLSEGK